MAGGWWCGDRSGRMLAPPNHHPFARNHRFASRHARKDKLQMLLALVVDWSEGVAGEISDETCPDTMASHLRSRGSGFSSQPASRIVFGFNDDYKVPPTARA